MSEIIELVSKTYGLLGIFLVLPLVACLALWRENKRITTLVQENSRDSAKCIQDCNDKIVEAQKQRVVDAQSITAKLIELVSEQASVGKETNLALERFSEILSDVRARFN